MRLPCGNARVDEARVKLSPQERRALIALAGTPGQLVTFGTLRSYLGLKDTVSGMQALRSIMMRLRKRLPSISIEAEWGVGYTATGIEQYQQTQEVAVPSAKPPRPTVATKPQSTGSYAAWRQKFTPFRASQSYRAEELGVIERFLAERGVSKCPGPREVNELSLLTWDKNKRKFVRQPVK